MRKTYWAGASFAILVALAPAASQTATQPAAAAADSSDPETMAALDRTGAGSSVTYVVITDPR